MKHFFLISWLIICLLFPSWAHDRVPLESILPTLEAYVDQSMLDEGIPGTVLVIVKDGKVVYVKGFGVKVWGGREKVDEHTPFALASVTKNMTNTLVARLVDQGKIHWKDKVSQYLPNFHLNNPQVTEEFTIEDLLSHRSGLPGFTADSLIELGWSASEVIPVMKVFPLEGEFRKTYAYQNVMVGLVGNIMEKVTGKPLAQVYQEELFGPIGLKETRFGKGASSTLWEKVLSLFKRDESQPTFHDIYHGKTRFLPKGNPGLYTFPASSGIISTGHDLGKWLIFQLNKAQLNGQKLVSETNIQAMRSPHVDVSIQGGRQFPKNRVTKVQYGMGWFIHDYVGVSMLSHMGGMAGTRSLLLIIPSDNVGIAILSNFGGMRVSLFPEAIRNKFLDLYLNVADEVDWARKLREDIQASREKHEKQRRLEMMQMLAPARSLGDYMGTYENSLYGRVDIGKGDDVLILTYRDRPPLKLDHWNGNAFQFNGSDLSSGFSGTDLGEVWFGGEQGKPDRLMITLFHEGSDTLFYRVS